MKRLTAFLQISVMVILLSALFQFNPLLVAGVLAVGGLVVGNMKGAFNMAIVASIVDIRGKAYEPIIEEILFDNETVAQNLVAFETDVKAETIFTENSNTAVMQAYTCGVPTSAGQININDTPVTPTKVMFYQEFCPDNLRTSRFKRTMKSGAWNTASTEFEKVVLTAYSALISLDAEQKFWSGITAATKTAIAASSASTAEKTWAAAQTAVLVDGIVAKMIFNNGAAGTRKIIVGTTITTSNIAAEYAKVYSTIPAEVLAGPVQPFIYAPRSHRQMINIFNISQTYRDIFTVTGKSMFYLGVEIKFVPLPENVMVAGRPDHFVWCTDLIADLNKMEINKIANNREDMFVKHVFTQASHVVNQKFNVLYMA